MFKLLPCGVVCVNFVRTLAAGFGIAAKDIPEFRRRVNEYARTVQMPFAALKLDCRLKPQFISADLRA